MLNNRVLLPPKLLGETKTYDQFDFTSQLATGETISTAVCTATVYSGTDASPSSIISGSAAISTPIISQKLTAGILGVCYLILCAITTSAGQTLILSGYLVIEQNAS